VARQTIRRHPVAAFLVIGIAVYFAAALIPPLVAVEIPPFDLPLYASLGTIFGVGLAAFVVTAATDGRRGVEDLVRRSLRWRVHPRWYVIALLGVPVATTVMALAIYGGDASPDDGWVHVCGAFLVYFVLQFVLFNLVEEIGWTGFLQERMLRNHAPLKACALVAVPWGVWHLPDFFVEEGLSLAQLALAPVFLIVETVLLFFARVLIVSLYQSTGRSVLLVGIFHASFDATISKLAKEVIPASNGVRFILLNILIVLGALAVIFATRGRLSTKGR
jgi:CAAX protease family protein